MWERLGKFETTQEILDGINKISKCKLVVDPKTGVVWNFNKNK